MLKDQQKDTTNKKNTTNKNTTNKKILQARKTI